MEINTSVAIVGMSCRFAGCPSPAALWNAVMASKNCLTPLGPHAALPFGARRLFPGSTYPKVMGQLGDLYSCVASMQNFPRQVNAGENQDLYFATQLAFDALNDCSMRPHATEAVNGSVRIGYAPPFNASTINWLQHTSGLEQTMDILSRFFPNAPTETMEVVRNRLTESLPAPNASSFLLGSGYRFASWIARECSFTGEAVIMDSGLVTGAALFRDAVGDLLTGSADVALVGALTPSISRDYLEGLAGVVKFSDASDYFPFAEQQRGTLPGEGGAFFVLKRREDALRDHDRIYAVIKSVSLGRNPENDPSAVLASALDKAGVSTGTVALIEADGTGIDEAEQRELVAISRLWGEHTPGKPLVGVGSVKGNIGHTLRASMAAGVVKTALALYRKVLPPQIMPDRSKAVLSDLSSSAYLLSRPRPWITGDSANPRRAVVLGANFDSTDLRSDLPRGGRAAAIVLEEEPEDRL